jgi:hypothetical protein
MEGHTVKKLLIAAAAVTLLLGPAAAHAQETMGGLGFRTLDGPSFPGTSISASPAIGFRQWFTPRMGLDVAVGITTISVESGPPLTTTDEGTGFVFDVGVPFSAKKWDKVNFIFRPGVQYGRSKLEDKTALAPPNEVTSTLLSVSGELEVEYMFVDKVSISASHGIAYNSLKSHDNDTPENEFNITGFDTRGDNFTQLGFHVYLW